MRYPNNPTDFEALSECRMPYLKFIFVLEVFKCFETCYNDTSTSLNSDK
jgi:hypothetical protein